MQIANGGGIWVSPSGSDIFSVSASPGFTWGRSGNTPTNTWLYNDTVPSNKAGRLVFLENAQIVAIFVSNELNNTFDVGIYEHQGGSPTLLHTLSLTSQRSKSENNLEIDLTTDYELAVRITSGSAKNPVVGCIIQGDFVA